MIRKAPCRVPAIPYGANRTRIPTVPLCEALRLPYEVFYTAR
jgi:hypothetical protein